MQLAMDSIACHWSSKSLAKEISSIPYRPLGHVRDVTSDSCLNVGKFLQRCKVNKAHLIRGFMIMSLAKLTLRFLPTAFKTRVEIHGWHTLFHETVVIRASEESLVRHRVRT